MTLEDTTKYLIHADVSTEGIVERSDVVGAIFGQTEGLLGDEMDLRELQAASKVGRIDVEIDSADGRSVGTVTIATSLDKVETATLGAALETITQIGPCRATIEVTDIEDVRAARRREVVERATELLEEVFDDTVMSSQEILAKVREEARADTVTEYEDLPAGPNVADSDAVVVVEGRADVVQLLQYGIKNAVAVEGTDVPDAVAALTEDRTVTAFLDADRGGDLILKELAQVGDIDYVAFAPPGTSVEDCTHEEVFTALREKVPYGEIEDVADPRATIAATDGSAPLSPSDGDGGDATTGVAEDKDDRSLTDARTADATEPSGGGSQAPSVESPDSSTNGDATAADPTGDEAPARGDDEVVDAESTAEQNEGDVTGSGRGDDGDDEDRTLNDHVRSVIGGATGAVRLIDREFDALAEAPAEDAFDAIESAEEVPELVVLDGRLTQPVLDVAAQLGVGRIVAAKLGEFTKRPTGIRIHTAEDVGA